MIGKIVGNYKIIQALGEGGVGMVYKGVDTMLDREVAIKVLRPELASQTSVVERFRSEAVTLAKLSHPNIATLYSLFRDGQDLLMVLEFLKGETLDHKLYRERKIPTDEAIPIFCQALEGINYAHKLGIVHRDIKPGNMMLTESGNVKVLDFGIARLLGSARMTRVGNVIGTLEYMSPEQVRGHETDARSDVYGLGIMLYEMLTGRLPFESENDFALMKMQTENTPIPPRELNPEIPFEVENAIMKSVAKDPDCRFQSAGDFLDYFLEMGYNAPTGTFGFSSIFGRKPSRPSNPGLQSGEVSTEATLPIAKVEPNATLPLVKLSDGETLPIANVQTDATLPLVSIQDSVQNTLPPSQIPTATMISQPDIPSTLEISDELKNAKIAETRLAPNRAEIKGTRLAAPAQIEMKATRLGAPPINQPDVDYQEPSFFSKLNWIHYTGAGLLVFIFFTLITTAGILSFVRAGSDNGSKTEQKTPANSLETTQTPKSVNQPVAKDEPTKTTAGSGDGGTPIVPSDSSSISNTGIPIGTPIPTGAKPAAPQQPSQKQPKEPETARTNAPTVKQQPKPQPQQPRTSGGATANQNRRTIPSDSGSKGRARDILTEN